jgi:hypothetical protein
VDTPSSASSRNTQIPIFSAFYGEQKFFGSLRVIETFHSHFNSKGTGWSKKAFSLITFSVSGSVFN